MAPLHYTTADPYHKDGMLGRVSIACDDLRHNRASRVEETSLFSEQLRTRWVRNRGTVPRLNARPPRGRDLSQEPTG